ncbi:MAG TPA: alpha/beta hydrolase-fold protein [Steroidobacteraceae bacterium]|nr:alpha/beta hydrolase-fold protein [Steroidobacteraceae bacterium]
MFRKCVQTLLLAMISLAVHVRAQPVEAETYTRTVHFEVKAPEASAAFLCGNMTGWKCDQIPMRRTGAGVFYVNAPLRPGRVEYVFMVDGQPRLDDASMPENDAGVGQRSWFVLDDDRDAQPLRGIPQGRIEQRTFESKALGEPRAINVYTPPGYTRKHALPLLILLHGYGMNADQWLTGGVQHYLDRYIAAGALKPMVVVMPGAPDEFYTGRSEEFVVKELYPWIAREYAIRQDAGAAAIGGMSMGGFGALYLAYRHPELFGHAMVLSPGNLDHDFLDRFDGELGRGARVAASLDIRVGRSDDLSFPYAERLTAVLSAHGVPFSYEVSRGIHDWNYWHSVMKPSLLRVQAFFDKPR